MPSIGRDTITIPYGRAKIAADDRAGPAVTLFPGRALRLSDGPYPFDEPPDLIRATTTPERLALLSQHLQSLCDLWDRPARLFLETYFQFIAAAIDVGATEIAAQARRVGGLFVPADWSFAALRPLPQAHLAVSGGAAPVRVEFAFWTGAATIAVTLEGSASPRRQRREELALLAAAGVAIVAVPVASLQQDGARLLARLLPAPFQRFWHDVSLPASPFGPPALDEIVAAGEA